MPDREQQYILEHLEAILPWKCAGVVVAEYHRHPPELPLPSTCLPNHRFSIMLSGSFRTDLARHGVYETVRTTPGDALILQPLCRHFNAVYENCESLAVVLYFGMLRLVWSFDTEKAAIYYIRDTLRPVTISAISTLGLLGNSPEDLAVAAQLVPATLELICQDLRNSRGESNGKGRETWNQITQYLLEHFQEEITRERVAEQFQISAGHVSHLFQRYCKDSFCDYLLNLRLQLAARMLREEHLTIGEIAGECGFGSTTYFIRQFRRNHGVTPGEYRFSHHA